MNKNFALPRNIASPDSNLLLAQYAMMIQYDTCQPLISHQTLRPWEEREGGYTLE